jgi:hypothetical protein
LHPHLNLKTPARIAQPIPVAAAPVRSAINPVHASVEALANEMGADRSPAEDYILGGADAPEVAAQIDSAAARYPASESYRPLEAQPLAQPRKPEKKSSGWGFFGRKKAPDLRTEPAPEPRMAAPRATAQPMPPMPQAEAARNNADDLFPDHKRDEQFEIPAFLRRQSN